DAATLEKRFEVPLPREPRAVLVSENGRDALVAHAVGGHLSRVSLADPDHAVTSIEVKPAADPPDFPSQKPAPNTKTSCQTYALVRSAEPAGRVLAPGVAVTPGQLDVRSSGYGVRHQTTEMPAVAVIPEATYETVPESVGTRPSPRAPCLLPRAAALEPGSNSLLVTCFGSNL